VVRWEVAPGDVGGKKKLSRGFTSGTVERTTKAVPPFVASRFRKKQFSRKKLKRVTGVRYEAQRGACKKKEKLASL